MLRTEYMGCEVFFVSSELNQKDNLFVFMVGIQAKI